MRDEYRRLLESLWTLTTEFGFELSTCVRDDLTALVRAMDAVDAALDCLPRAEARRNLEGGVLAVLGGSQGDALPAVHALAVVAARRGVTETLVERVADVFEVGEALRLVTAVRPYERMLREEGRPTVQMALAIMGPTPPRFERFFVALGDVGYTVDELLDLTDDHRRGQKLIDPGPWTRFVLVTSLGWHAVRLVALHPRPWRLVRWSMPLLQRVEATA